MRKITAILMSLLLLWGLALSTLGVSATQKADILNGLNLFLGADTGYELERVPTRAEAATMLVRLLGRETEAKAAAYTTPFTDVPEWAAPYVGLLYSEGITKGMDLTLFGSNYPCEDRMYITFVLRSLGYKDSEGDFSYEAAVAFARQIGLINPEYEAQLAEKTFLRDDMVSISFDALFLNLKGEKKLLLEKLVDEQAVSAESCEALLKKHSVHSLVGEAVKKNKNLLSLRSTTEASYSVTSFAGISYYNMKLDLTAAELGSDTPMLSLNVKTTGGGRDEEYSLYLKDGYTYIDLGGGVKLKAPLEGPATVADAQSLLGNGALISLLSENAGSLGVESIISARSETFGGYTVITEEYLPAYIEHIFWENLSYMFGTPYVESENAMSLSVSLTPSTLKCITEIDPSGYIASQRIIFSLEISTDDGVFILNCDSTETFESPGKLFFITFPDFKDYIEITE